ncbi:MAG: hypothetical protein ACE5GO_02590 [Anaerolineales bacterium]
MNNQTKSVQGQLLDLNSKEVVAEDSVSIVLAQAGRPDERPKYTARMTVEGYKPELDSKTHILRLSEDLAGKVILSLVENPGQTQTQFVVILHDPVWHDLDWFESL